MTWYYITTIYFDIIIMYNKKYDIYCKTTYVSYKEGLKEILHTISGVEKGKP